MHYNIILLHDVQFLVNKNRTSININVIEGKLFTYKEPSFFFNHNKKII